MENSHIVKRLDHFFELVNSVDPSLATDVNVSIDASKPLTGAAFTKKVAALEDESSLLKIGIIGRVKAGKSSLINSLIFKGQDVLPKAATPMTAALVSLTYAEQLSATVEFFTPEDIKGIKTGNSKYKQLLEQKIAKLQTEKEQSPAVNGNKPVDMERLKRQAKRELDRNEPNLKAASELYTKMQNSGVDIDSLPEKKELKSDTTSQLAAELNNYVGAKGTYMPFSKILHIKLPVEELKDLEVVDTPGLNDAVRSREQRTYDMLGECNAVFIVSPSGQFLTADDLSLCDRLTKREGVQEIFTVASQVDNQLFASEKDKYNALLPDVINGVKQTMSTQVCSAYSVHDNEVLKDIANQSTERLIVSSGVCQTLLKQPENTWDANAKTVLARLKDEYTPYFATQEAANNNLALLSARDELLNKLATVRERKNEIVQQQRQNINAEQTNLINTSLNALCELFAKRKQVLTETDISELTEKQASLSAIRENGISSANDIFDEHITKNIRELVTKPLQQALDKMFASFEQTQENAQGTATETYEVDADHFGAGVCRFFGLGGTTTETKTIDTLKPTPIHRALQGLHGKIKGELLEQTEVGLIQWKTKFKQALYLGMQKQMQDKVTEAISTDELNSCLRRLVEKLLQLPNPQVPEIPASLKKNSLLKGSSVDSYLDDAERYYDTLKSAANTHLDAVRSSIRQQSKSGEDAFGERLFKTLDKQLAELAEQVENKAEFIAKLDHYHAQCKELLNA